MEQQRYYELRERISYAQRRKEIYDAHIAPYVQSKSEALFKAFCNVQASDTNQLQLIKMQHSVLMGLERDFINDIEDGVVADAELKQSGD